MFIVIPREGKMHASLRVAMATGNSWDELISCLIRDSPHSRSLAFPAGVPLPIPGFLTGTAFLTGKTLHTPGIFWSFALWVLIIELRIYKSWVEVTLMPSFYSQSSISQTPPQYNLSIFYFLLFFSYFSAKCINCVPPFLLWSHCTLL